jgi:metallo-beta-lactamase family protein
MDVRILGAGREVTGSCFQLRTATANILIDCGMFQGPERLERLNVIPKELVVKSIDAVLVTHGHLDHCGRLPLLIKAGYKGPIFCTAPTADIVKLILHDAAKISYEDTIRDNRKRARQDLPPLQPLFTEREVERVAKQMKTIEYDTDVVVRDGVVARFVDAGHILGSASIILTVTDDSGTQRVAFSGDIGTLNAPLLRDPASVGNVDCVFMETTYGDRNHRGLLDTILEFEEYIKAAVAVKGKILIPTFAVGRTQLLLFALAKMFKRGLIPKIPVFLDSPMGIAATDIYARWSRYMDEEARQWYASGDYLSELSTLRLCTTVDDSKALNFMEGPYVIMAGAGMCNAGRIMHHLRHSLGYPETVVLIVGYQAKGSTGRLLLDGAKEVRIFGETIKVRATIRGLGGFSAHAGQEQLLSWVEPLAKAGKQIVLIHGESSAVTAFAAELEQRFGISPDTPRIGSTVHLGGTQPMSPPDLATPS